MKHAKLGVSMAILVGLGGVSAVAVLAQPAPAEAPPPRLEHKVFVEIRDKDGVIDQSEATGPLKTHFDEIDTNKDGKLSSDELVAFNEKHGPPGGAFRECRMIVVKEGNGKAQENAAPRTGPRLIGPPMALFDKNADGKLSREEFLKGQSDMFDRMDANKDGFLTPDEGPGRHMGERCPPPGDLPPPPPR